MVGLGGEAELRPDATDDALHDPVADRVAFPGKLFTVESVAAAFKGAKKKDIEGFLDGFAALGVLTAFEGADGKRWRAAGRST